MATNQDDLGPNIGTPLARATAAAPVYTEGAPSPLSQDLSGNLRTSGAGGAVTIANGADVTQGVTTGAAVVTDANGTIQQYLRGLVKLLVAKITVGIDQTTPGANGVAIAGDMGAGEYETVAAGQTDQIMGATGAVGDYLAGVLIVPGTTAAGAVSIKDGNGSSISIFPGGGTTALSALIPFFVPLGIKCLNATTPGWKITTGTNVTAIGVGNFT